MFSLFYSALGGNYTRTPVLLYGLKVAFFKIMPQLLLIY
jgi:hypothetical protein